MACSEHGRQTEEQRIALVLNGGVSLAVWMAGVVNEVNALTRVSHGKSTRFEGSGAAWSRILNQSGKECIQVDLIAGTSAGGLNGAFLAHAVANGQDLFDMKQIWVEEAVLDTAHLLNHWPESAQWFLDGEFFQEAIRQQMPEPNKHADAPPPTVTLLTTATAIDAEPLARTDDVGHEYSFRDSRRVYAFRQRSWRPEQSHLTDRETLALAARASAGFPVAFEPVRETEALRGRRMQGEGPTGLLMDGGVLDNAPFEPLLTELRSMPINGRRSRHLLYVTPDVGRNQHITPDVANNAGVESAGVDWLSELSQVASIVREGDTRFDEVAIRQAKDDSSFQESRPHRVLIKWMDDPDTAVPVGRNLLRQYRAGRQEALQRWLQPTQGEVYEPPPGLIPPDPTDATEADGDLTLASGDPDWCWGLAVAQRISNWFGRAAANAADQSLGTDTQLETAFERVEALQQCIADWVEPFNNAVDYTERIAALDSFYRSDNLRVQLSGLIADAGTAVGEIFGSEQVLELALRLEVLTSTWSWIDPASRDAPAFNYRRITPAGEPPFDDPFFAEMPDWARSKLVGQRWGHFGAFATVAARENDWLWGRIDGALALIDMLFDAGSTESGLAEAKQQIVDAILLEELRTRSGQKAEAVTLRQELVVRTSEICNLTWRELYALMNKESPNTYGLVKSTLFGLLSQPNRFKPVSHYVALTFGEKLSRDQRRRLPIVVRLFARRIGRTVDKRLRRWLLPR